MATSVLREIDDSPDSARGGWAGTSVTRHRGPNGSTWRSRLTGEGFAATSGPPRSLTLVRSSAAQPPAGPEHVAQFYEHDAYLEVVVASYCLSGFAADDAVVLIVTRAHWEHIEARLRQAGCDLPELRTGGRLVFVDADAALADLLRDGEINAERFADVVAGAIAAAAGGRAVRVFGELVALLAIAGKHAAALDLERLWHDAQARYGFSLLCAYPLAPLGGVERSRFVASVCAAHSQVVPAESFTSLASADEREQAIVALQQKEQWLEVEIAERKRAEERLQAALDAERIAREEAEAALRLRDEFLAVAAHELRNPMAIIRGWSQFVARRLARDRSLDAETTEQAVASISGQVDRLVLLLDRVLDVARLEAGRVHLEPAWVDVAALCRRVVADAGRTGISEAIAVEAPAALVAFVDGLRCEQLLGNLLDNAARHHAGEVSIEVSLRRVGADEFALSVRDRGPGIPEEKRAHLFERFFQVDPSASDGGLGLGLFVCRQIAELHGGTIEADFPEDGGTRFTARFPVQPLDTNRD
jgi:signal transduction histidine kinase